MNIMSIMLPEQRGRNGARADARERAGPKGKTEERGLNLCLVDAKDGRSSHPSTSSRRFSHTPHTHPLTKPFQQTFPKFHSRIPNR